MSKAKIAAEFIKAFSAARFPGHGMEMETSCVNWLQEIDNAIDSGSYKYIPTDILNNDLKLPQGAGVYNYRQYEDGSYLLLTCDAGVCYWDGPGHDAFHLKREQK